MISEPNEMIEKFILGELKGKTLNDFEREMKESPELASEVELLKDISIAINEKAVMELRSNLKAICGENSTLSSDKVFFDIAQNITLNPNKDISDTTVSENSLQQIHIETHKKSMNERVHQINFQTNQYQNTLLTKQISDFSFWEEIKDAVQEKDIIDLRNNLKEIASQNQIGLSDYEIDEYLSNELTSDINTEYEHLIASDKKIADHVSLHKEIDMAIQENDIINLRNSLAELINKEQQINSSELKRIDDYLLNYLDKDEKANFETKLDENIKLEEEVQFNKELNEAIVEKDIIKIRATLSGIVNEDKNSNKIRKFIPFNFKEKPLQYASVAASIAAIVSAGYLSLNNENMNAEKLFRDTYRPYEASGLFRSATISNPAINGVDLYNAHRYDEALQQFSEVLNENNEHPMSNFFTGLCFMEKNQFDHAVTAFQKVINEKDNLFVEQAQWYMALSLLGSNKEKNAYELLNQIVLNNGYYRKNAKELLKKIK